MHLIPNEACSTTPQRIKWVDCAKAVSIFLVVLLHTHCNATLSKYINGFIMPAFFLLSGYLFSYKHNPAFRPFAIKRFRQLAIPYFWIGIVSYLSWLTVLRHFGNDAGIETPWSRELLANLFAIPELMSCNVPLWALMSFFVTEIIYYPLGKYLSDKWITVLFLSLSFILYVCHFPGSMLPFAAGPSLCGVAFYAIGRILRTRSDVLNHFLTPATALLLFILSVRYNGEITFFSCNYSNFLLFLTSSLSGSILIFSLCSLASSKIKRDKLICFIANGSLLVCGFHILVFSAIKGLAFFCFGLEPSTLTDGVLHGIPFAVLAFVLTFPIIVIIRKYFRFLIGK
ncbi:MAG: acyltransferase family protein [Bacteroides sp.]|nr:acyltransferase family protein [Bacteroides sp.]